MLGWQLVSVNKGRNLQPFRDSLMARVVQCGCKIAEVFAQAHPKGMILRDVKAANAMLAESQIPRNGHMGDDPLRPGDHLPPAG